MRAIIVDDEQQSHDALMILLKKNHPDIQVVGQAYNVKDGIAAIKNAHPDLIFLDIAMPDGDGFELLSKIKNRKFETIFITAYNDRAIDAFNAEAIHYLLKPPSENGLSEAIKRVINKLQKGFSEDQLKRLAGFIQNQNKNSLPSKIRVSTIDGILFKPIKDIIWLKADGGYTMFYFAKNHSNLLASTNIGIYEERFKPYQEFMKVHRSHIVNLNFVDKYVKSDGGYLVMLNGDEVEVSRRYRDELLERMRDI